jgi:hypothetical protein
LAIRRHLTTGQILRPGQRPENVQIVTTEVENEDLVQTITDQDATPSVKNSSQYTLFKTANTVATTITDFDDGEIGQVVRVIINDANTTIDFTASGLKGNAGVDWSPTTGDHMTCVYDGTDWYCDISDNTA